MLPLTLSLLAFAIVWRLGGWLIPVNDDDTEAAWSVQDQIAYDVALPEDNSPPKPTPNGHEEDEAKTHSEVTQEFTIQSGDNLGAYFKQAGIDAGILSEILKANHAQYLKRIYPGQVLRLQSNAGGKLEYPSIRN